MRSSRSKAHASELAVVSCPARTSVSSSSRSSSSLSGSPVLVARVQQQREDVASRLDVASAARRSAISRIDVAVELGDAPLRRIPIGSLAADVDGARRAARSGGVVEMRQRRRSASRRPALGRAPARARPSTPKIAGHDHLERDRLHPRRERERLVRAASGRSRARPPRAIICDVALDRLAVEGRQQQLALAHVAPRRASVSTELGPRIGRSGDSPVSDGASSAGRP